MLAEILIRGMMLALTIWLARVYNSEVFGIYALALSVGNLFEIIFNVGLNTVFMQRVAHSTDKIADQLSLFLPLRLILSTISFIFFTVFVLILQKNSETFLTLILAGFYFSLFSVLAFLWSCFDAKQKMEFTAGTKFLKFSVIFIIGIYFISNKAPIHQLLYSYLAGVILALFITFFLVNKYFAKIKMRIDFAAWKKILSEGWPITLSGTFIFIYNYLDTIIISLNQGESAVGLYQVSYKIIGTLFILATLINQVYLPSLIEIGQKNRQKLSEIFNKSLQSVFFWSIPITFGALMLSERIILFVFGSEYINAVPAFKILIWNCLIYFISSAMSNLLYALRQQKKAAAIFFVGAAINTILNFFIIPKYGIEGAAATTILAELVVLIGIYLSARQFVQIRIFSNMVVPLVSGLIMVFSLVFIKTDSLFITIAIGALIYFGTYFGIARLPILNKLEFNTSQETLPKDLP